MTGVDKYHLKQMELMMNLDYDYSIKDVSKALEDIEVSKGDHLFIHSNLGYLGKPEGGLNTRNIGDSIYQGIKNVVGDEGTICVPAFPILFVKVSLQFKFDATRRNGNINRLVH